MLSQADRDKIQAATENTVDTLGVPMTWTQAKAPNATADIVAGFKSASWRDEELINAYGIGAKIFTVKVSDIAFIEKFDRMTVGTDKYTIDSVMPVYLNGVRLFWKAIVRGK